MARGRSIVCLMKDRNFVVMCIFRISSFTDLLPTNVAAGPETKEFLLKVIDVLLEFIKTSNDRNEKVLDFHHPEDMKKLLQLEIPDSPVSLQQLIVDCTQTLKYQVKTGELRKRPVEEVPRALWFPDNRQLCVFRFN